MRQGITHQRIWPRAHNCWEFALIAQQARDLRHLDGVNVGTAPTLLVRKRSIIYSSALMRVIITKGECGHGI